MRAGRWVMAVVLWVPALASCRSPATPPAVLPAGPHVLEVSLRDFSFAYDEPVPAGRVLFKVKNVGSVAHSLTVLPLTDDIPPIHEQLRGSERRAILPFAEEAAREPGDRTTFAADLEPGVRYAFVCFVQDEAGLPHTLKGMASEFRAGGGPSEGARG